LIVFSHANSFPASTYKVLFKSLRSRGFAVKALEKLGHDARFPVTDNWPHLIEQLAAFVAPLVEKAGEPAWLVGHSLGGYVSVMTAARYPHLARGVLLIDSPLVGGWRSSALGVMKTTQVFGSLSPGAVSRKRRNTWPDTQAVFDHFRHKKAFAHWDEQVLWDYVNHGTVEADGKRVLTFDRDIETLLYNTVPDNIEKMFERQPPKCPVSFLGGLQSQEIRQVGLGLTERVCQGRTMMLSGSHLFPMEKPFATAAAIEAAILNLG
jgi:pimeloyl-ACP methyl ester carboxylesterase